MNASLKPDPDFESLLRQRASRLPKPDPAWREEILGTAENETSVRTRPSNRPLWKTRWFPGSLAACWLVIPFLNWCAERETQRFSQYANAQAVPMILDGGVHTVLLAAASGR